MFKSISPDKKMFKSSSPDKKIKMIRTVFRFPRTTPVQDDEVHGAMMDDLVGSMNDH